MSAQSFPLDEKVVFGIVIEVVSSEPLEIEIFTGVVKKAVD